MHDLIQRIAACTHHDPNGKKDWSPVKGKFVTVNMTAELWQEIEQAATGTLPSDTQILDWFERQHTLHRAVEVTYVVDGYSVEITYDGTPLPGKAWHGETVRQACAAAMKEWDVTHGETGSAP